MTLAWLDVEDNERLDALEEQLERDAEHDAWLEERDRV